MKALLPAQLKKVASRADRTYDLVFNTRELTGIEASFLLGELMKEGWLQYAPNEDEMVDIPDEKADPMTGTKTQAQRLRAALYVLWKQRGGTGNSEDFYRSYMENIIDQIKSKLEG